MLRTVDSESSRARAIPRRSPFTSVTWALLIATSVPVPIAIPTFARASAGASLIPSPAIATRRPSRCKRATRSALSCGRTSPYTSSIPNRLRRRSAVASCHDDANARLVQRLDRRGGRFLDRIVDGEQSRKLTIDGEEDDARAVRPQALGVGSHRCRLAAGFTQQCGIAEGNRAILNATADSDAGAGLELLRLGEYHAATSCGFNDRVGERMFTPPFISTHTNNASAH